MRDCGVLPKVCVSHSLFCVSVTSAFLGHRSSVLQRPRFGMATMRPMSPAVPCNSWVSWIFTNRLSVRKNTTSQLQFQTFTTNSWRFQAFWMCQTFKVVFQRLETSLGRPFLSRARSDDGPGWANLPRDHDALQWLRFFFFLGKKPTFFGILWMKHLQ